MMQKLSGGMGLVVPVLYVALIAGVCGAAEPVHELPIAAQIAIAKGVAASQRQDWNETLRNFAEARRTAPFAPQVLFNTGLAESKIPGRELRSIVWLRSYLAAEPNAQNRGAVNDLIAALESQVRRRSSELLERAKAIAEKLPDRKRETNLANIGDVYLKIGDPAKARQIADQLRLSKDDVVLRLLAGLYAGMGDFRSAREVAERISDPRSYNASEAYMTIAKRMAKVGNVDDAQSLADRIQDPFSRTMVYLDCAYARAEAGDAAGALRTYKLSNEPEGVGLYLAIARGYSRSGKKEEARKAVKQALVIAGEPADFLRVAEYQIETGDFEGARESGIMVGWPDPAKVQDAIFRAVKEAEAPKSRENKLKEWSAMLDRKALLSFGGEICVDFAGYLRKLLARDRAEDIIQGIVVSVHGFDGLLEETKKMR